MKLFITADMISRSFAGVCDSHVFVMGTENAPGLRPWIYRQRADRPLSVDLLGADLLGLESQRLRPVSQPGAFRSSSSPPAKTRVITRPTTRPKRSTIPS